MHAADGAPMLRKRPALSASRKSAPPRAADLAVMPVPMAAPSRKCPRAKVAARFVDACAPRGRAGLVLVDLAIAGIRATRGRAHCMRLADHSYPLLPIERTAVDCRSIRRLSRFF